MIQNCDPEWLNLFFLTQDTEDFPVFLFMNAELKQLNRDSQSFFSVEALLHGLSVAPKKKKNNL